MTQQPVPIIITGAAGRMGATLCTLVTDAPTLYTLVGVTDKPEMLPSLKKWGVPISDDLNSLLDRIVPSVPDLVSIDFTSPEASLNHARISAKHGSGLVIGTTGLSTEQMGELRALAVKTTLFWAPNMSVGVNVMLRILPDLVRLLGESYDLEIMEIHHNRKKDAPSGTALAIANVLANARKWKLDEVARCQREGIVGERPQKEIGVQALRGGDVAGIHTVYCLGPGERIEVTHQAHSRDNFASGALRAAAWIHKKEPGKLYSMEDFL